MDEQQIEQYIPQPPQMYADGTPVEVMPNTIYPCYTARYLGFPVPDALLAVDENYRKAAAQSALEWGISVLSGAPRGQRASTFRVYEQGTAIFVTYPLQFEYGIGEPALPYILPVVDTFRNNSDWDGSTIPPYVEAEARFLLWCLKEDTGEDIESLLVARITGNLPTDVTFRTVYADTERDSQIAQRVIRAAAKALAAGDNLFRPSIPLPSLSWGERKQAEEAAAYQTQDEALYQLLAEYMQTCSRRRELEAKVKELDEQKKALAVALSAQIPAGAEEGELKDKDHIYTVSHRLSARRPITITPGIVRQFAPVFAQAIDEVVVPRGDVHVTVL